ncbi:MAG: protein kinase [Planctomycetota bacterium]
MAVAKGYLRRPDADEALNIQRATAEDGEEARQLRDIVVEEGWMRPGQVKEVDEEAQGGGDRTGRIKGYRLLAKIGQGGMGSVYRAEKEDTGELVALKVLPRRMAEREDFVERFLREARAASQIESKYIVPAVDVGFSGGYYYFAMEFVEGESVETTLSIDGSIAESKALRIILQMARALEAAGRAGMVHRDIKPGNIIVTETGAAKLTDFGLAREIDDHSVTQTGVTLGTPNYMSPEQAKASQSLDVRSDVYSLGVTFYHMLTATVPFKGETSLLTMLKHINEEPVEPINRRPDLSPACNAIVLKMLAKHPDDRYTPEQLVRDVELVLDGKPPKYARIEPPEGREEEPAADRVPEEIERFAHELRRQRRVRWLKALVFLFVAGLVAYAAWELSHQGGPVDTSTAGGSSGKTGGHTVEPAEADPGREQQANQALDDARTFAREHPGEHVAKVDRFADALEAARGTKLQQKAQRLHDEARNELNAAIREAFRTCAARAERCKEAGLFGDAVRVYEQQFPQELRTEQTIRRIEQAKSEIGEDAWDRFRSLTREVENLIESKKFDTARSRAERAKGFGVSGIRTKANALLTRIEKAQMAAESDRERQVIEAYRAAFTKVRAHVRRGDFVNAQRELNHQMRLTTDAEARDRLAANRPILDAAQRAWGHAVAGARALKPGTKITIGNRIMEIRRFDPRQQRLHLQVPGGGRRRISLGWLPAARIESLIQQADGKVAAIDLAALFLARGDFAGAARMLEKARKEKADAARIERYEEQLALLQRSRREIEAENLFARATEQAGSDAGHEQIAHTLWELVDNYANTRFYAAHRDEIGARLVRAEQEQIHVDTLFAVDPAPVDGGQVELRYDFSDRAQKQDWLTVWKKSSYGRWSIRPRYGEMTAESGLLYFKVSLRGAHKITVRIKDARKAAIRAAMPTPTASPRSGIHFEWRREGDGAVLSLRKGGEVDTERVKSFRIVGDLELTLDIDRRRTIAGAGSRDGRMHRVKLPGRKDDEPGYLVLDEFNRTARLTSAVVTCKLDRGRLEQDFVRRLQAEKREAVRWRMARYQPLLAGAGADDWRRQSPDGGEWEVSPDGVARATPKTTCVMTTGDMNWSDYAFAAQVRTGRAGGWARLLFRWSDASGAAAGGPGYYVALKAGQGTSGAGGQIELGKTEQGKPHTLKDASINLTGAEWAQVRVEVRGNRIRVVFGGREVFAASDSTYTAGRVGLASFRSGASFRDVKIKLDE